MTEIIYKKPLSVMGKKECYITLRTDLYKGDCENKCRYCYGSHLNNIFKNNDIILTDMDIIKQHFIKAFETESKSNISKLIRKKTPIRINSMVGIPKTREDIIKMYKEFFQFLNSYDYPFALIIKNTSIITRPDFIEVLQNSNENSVIQVSVLYNDDMQKVIEPYADTTQERISGIKTLAENNINVVLRVCPINLDTDMEDVYNIIKEFENVDNVNKIILEQLRLSSGVKKEWKDLFGENSVKSLTEWKKGYYQYKNSLVYNKFKTIQTYSKKMGFQVSVCGNNAVYKLLNDKIYSSYNNCCFVGGNPHTLFVEG